LIENGKEEQGAQLHGAVEMRRTRTGADIANAEPNTFDLVIALDNDTRPEIQAAIARGRGMSVDEAMAITFPS
jgi:hypothetical protein